MAFSKVTGAGVATDTLKAEDIAADAIGTAELANDVSISTSGNIATTGSGTLTVAGASTHTGTSQLTGAVTLGTGSGSGGSWTLPTSRGTNDKYVLQINGTTGVAGWAESLTAPKITGISGNLNAYEAPLTPTGTWNDNSTSVTLSSGTDVVVGATVTGVGIANGTTVANISGTALTLSTNSTAAGAAGSPLVISKTVAEIMGGTLTITGINIGINTADLTVVIQRSDGTKVTTASRINSASGTSCEAQWFGNESNYDTFGNNETIYVKVTKAGLGSNILSSGKKFTTDPNITSEFAITQSGGVVTVAPSDTTLGSYGSGQVAGGGQDSNTKLLLNFDRTGGTDIEDSSNVGGDGHKITASGNATIKASPFGDGKSAIFFDGSDDRLTIPASSDWNFSTSDFTIEWWAYVHTQGNNDRFFTIGGDNVLFCHQETSTTIRVATPTYFDSTVNYNDSGWHHYAIVRQGTTLKFYFDGIYKSSKTDYSSSVDYSGNPIYIGANSSGGWPFHGYMDEFRIVVGTAVYTGDFDVPTSRLTAITNTKLLIHSNQVADSSDFNHPVTLYDNAIPKMIGDYSAWRFDGASDRISFPQYSNAFNLGTGAFTVEAYIHFINLPTTSGSGRFHPFYRIGGTGGNNLNLVDLMNDSGTYKLRYHDDDTGSVSVNWSTPSTGTWYHFAVTRNGAEVKFYIDGSQVGSTQTINASTPVDAEAGVFQIGGDSLDSRWFDGYIQNFRLTSMLVYTANFTKPTQSVLSTKTWSASSPAGYTASEITSGVVVANTTSSNVKLLVNGDGTKFDDSATSDHTITPTGSYHSQGHGGIAPAMTWPASQKATGSAGAYFDGDTSHDGDRINVSPSPACMHTNAKNTTVEFWFYCTGSGSRMSLFRSERFDHGQIGKNFLFEINASGTLKGWLLDAKSYAYATSPYSVYTVADFQTTFPNNQWHHFAFTHTGSSGGVAKVYVNGKYVAPDAATGSLWTGRLINESGHDLCFGGGESGSDTNVGSFKGYLEGIRVSDSIRYTGTSTSEWGNYDQPTKIYGAYGSETPSVGTITLTATPSTTSTTGTLANTSTAVTDITTSNIRVGDKVTGTGISGSGTTTVASITTESSADDGVLVLSQNTTGSAAGSQTLTFTPEIAFSEQGSSLPAGLSGNLADGGAGANTATITGTMTGTAGTATNVRIRMQANGDAARISEINESSGVGALQITKLESGNPTLFNARRYVGISASNNSVTNQEILGFGYQPDLLWFKNRDVARNHLLMDSVRGDNNWLQSQANTAAYDGTDLDAEFRSDGFIIKNGHSYFNENEKAHIAWAWKAGGAPSGNGKKIVDGTESNLTSGTDYSASDFSAIRQSVNTSGNFSITTYTANGSTDGWFKHGLSGTPDWVIIKCTSATYHWIVWHSGLNSGSSTNASDYIQLNANTQKGYYGGSANTSIDPWAGSGYGITSDKINLNYGGVVLESGQSYVCYAFKAVSGVSAFGTYEGTASDVTVSDMGFLPKCVMIKNIDSVGHWCVFDSFRDVEDEITTPLFANITDYEQSYSSYGIRFTATGFTLDSGTSTVAMNTSGDTYIYMAFA